MALMPETIAAAHALLHAGQLDPRDLLESCLDRIHRQEGRLHAWTTIDQDGARRAARQLAQEAADGSWRGPLHGIPLGIKDVIDVAELPTTAGSPLRTSHRAHADAPVVARLRAAGAVILGKTVTCEFAGFDPSPSRNPWDPRLETTAGGSSSGSAVAVAAGMCLGALGTQTGGSLVRPASYCGVATCKPTWGKIPTDGVVPVSPHLDVVGPIARCIDDLAILLRAIDPGIALEVLPPQRPPHLTILQDEFFRRADSAVLDAAKESLDRLRSSGAILAEGQIGINFDEIMRLHRRIMSADAAKYHRRMFAAHREQYGPNFRSMLEAGLAISMDEYAYAVGHQAAVRKMIFLPLGEAEAWIMPATESTAPRRTDTTGSPAFQAPWSYLGLPAVALPCGLAADGLPAGMQLVGPPGSEGRLLAVAKWCEERWGRLTPPEAA